MDATEPVITTQDEDGEFLPFEDEDSEETLEKVVDSLDNSAA